MSLTPIQISQAIEAVALEIIPDVVYLRATDQEANISADGLNLAGKIFCLYNNRPEISGSTNDENGLVIETIPVEISLLCLADYDDTDEDTDRLIDDLVGYARLMFDRLALPEEAVAYTDSYTIDMDGDMVKIYDKIMSGVKLSFDIVTQRNMSC